LISEVDIKLQWVRDLLMRRQLDGVLVSRVCNFAWLTGGAVNYNSVAVDAGSSTILVTADCQYLLTNNIEAPRLEAEEGLAEVGFRLRVGPWDGPNPAYAALVDGKCIGADTPRAAAVDVGDALNQLRRNLLPEDIARFRTCGEACAAAMSAAIARVQPGMSEWEIAAALAAETLARGTLPIVNLIGTDERIFRYRHPFPTRKRLERQAMLVLGGRRRGVVASLTRLIYFGTLPEELQLKQRACAQVDAAMIAATRPGKLVGHIFQTAKDAYASCGYAGEWQRHHQGGLAGYVPREILANANSTARVETGQVYAWNPSIAGVKSEDTLLVGTDGNEILTSIAGWPTVDCEVEGQSWQRPAILTA